MIKGTLSSIKWSYNPFESIHLVIFIQKLHSVNWQLIIVVCIAFLVLVVRRNDKFGVTVIGLIECDSGPSPSLLTPWTHDGDLRLQVAHRILTTVAIGSLPRLWLRSVFCENEMDRSVSWWLGLQTTEFFPRLRCQDFLVRFWATTFQRIRILIIGRLYK